VSGVDLVLASKEDEHVSEWLSDMDLQHRHHRCIHVVSLRSLRVVDVDGVAAAGDAKYRRVVEELSTYDNDMIPVSL